MYCRTNSAPPTATPSAGWPHRLGLALVGLLGLVGTAAAQTVPTYHGTADRSGLYVAPGLTWTKAASVHADTGFKPTIEGDVYAQPLYWLPQGATTGLVIVATESDIVYALKATTGAVVWKRSLGTPATSDTLPCGNIRPTVGITGTPVIDPTAGALYIDALVSETAGPRHKIFGLALATGKNLPGWPVGVDPGVRALGKPFDSAAQAQHSALTLANGQVYVTYGGNWGDCSTYHGTVLEVAVDPPKITAIWKTRANGGGIWAESGIASDGQSLFATTGNTMNTTKWLDGEAVIRLQPGLAHSGQKANWFTPKNWYQLDRGDTDLGGTGPLPIDVPATGGTSLARLLQLGKDGNAYLLDRTNLGGFGGQLAVAHVSPNEIITAAARYPTGGAAMVVFTGQGAACPAGQGGDLTMLRVTENTKTPITTAWCGGLSGGGAPVITTTNGTSNPIVWAVGALGDNQLHGFRATDGVSLYTSASLSGLLNRATILVAEGRLYVAGGGTIYAFSY